jgi:glycosyltransferase involved in cell wall biosynthesis
MQAGVPVITSNHAALLETGGKAVLSFDAGVPESLYEQCLRIYKDESLKNQLIAEGFEQTKQYSWQQTAGELNRLLLEMIAAKRKRESAVE